MRSATTSKNDSIITSTAAPTVAPTSSSRKKRKARQVYQRQKKRHCAEDEKSRVTSAMEMDSISSTSTSETLSLTSKNAHLKGRKRFLADLHDLQHATPFHFSFNGVHLSKIKPGDEEGSVELVISTADHPYTPPPHTTEDPILALTLFIDATSSYPRDHSLFSFTQNTTDLEPYLLQIIESIASLKPRPLERTVKSIMKSVAASVREKCFVPPEEEEEDQAEEAEEEAEESDQGSFYDYEYDEPPVLEPARHSNSHFDPQLTRHEIPFSLTLLRAHFNQIIKASYKPGFYTINPNPNDFEYALSVSYPISRLGVPPRALVAWDRRLVNTSSSSSSSSSEPSKVKRLVLVISGLFKDYPVLDESACPLQIGGGGGNNKIKFSVGLCEGTGYKPSKEGVLHAIRSFTSGSGSGSGGGSSGSGVNFEKAKRSQVDNSFEKFSLSSSFEHVLKEDLVPLLRIRLRYGSGGTGAQAGLGLGWAGAEVVWTRAKAMQTGVDNELVQSCQKEIEEAELEDQELCKTHDLPNTPLPSNGPLNFPLLAYEYLIRCFKLCTRYCQVCHTRTRTRTYSSQSQSNSQFQSQSELADSRMEIESLKPYICTSQLCTYQFYTFNFGLPIEYEVMVNTSVVDLLVSLTYVAAHEGQLGSGGIGNGVGNAIGNGVGNGVGDGLSSWFGSGFGYEGTVGRMPVGLGMRVPFPKMPGSEAWKMGSEVVVGEDGMVEFDELSIEFKRMAICEMLDCLPSIQHMKMYLEWFTANPDDFNSNNNNNNTSNLNGGGRPQLKDMDPSIPQAAWLILRWCVASSTSFIEEIEDNDEHVSNISKEYKQFRFSVGAPDKEARYRDALEKAKQRNENVKKYPVLYAFHGSPIRNWHSIIREGLLIKDALHGRAYGHGVYFSQDASVSMNSYATSFLVHRAASSSSSSKSLGSGSDFGWSKSAIGPISVVALAEIVNLPKEFTSSNPYYVVQNVDWIMCRYLLVKKGAKPQLSNQLSLGSVVDPKMRILAGLGPAPAPGPGTGLSPPAEELDNANSVVLGSPNARYMKLDPLNKLTIGSDVVRIPEQSYLCGLDAAFYEKSKAGGNRKRRQKGGGSCEKEECVWDWEDERIIFGDSESCDGDGVNGDGVVDVDGDIDGVVDEDEDKDEVEDSVVNTVNEWKHNEIWVNPNPNLDSAPESTSSSSSRSGFKSIFKSKSNPNSNPNPNPGNPLAIGYQLLPPPTHSTPRAVLALQREFQTMMKEQKAAEAAEAKKRKGAMSLRSGLRSSSGGAAARVATMAELGWFIVEDLMEDNLFRWIVELHSFDSSLPIAQDMANHNIPSFLFEIRFPDRFPIQPPFFRVIKPRVLPFAQGGGGHITAGGSICMDLLTSDGWLPSYSISAVLLQIKLAISNLEPQPARLAYNWQTPYSISEALEGYKRAANAHGWKIPEGIERIAQ